jgi:hypothetical protein
LWIVIMFKGEEQKAFVAQVFHAMSLLLWENLLGLLLAVLRLVCYEI